jgi:hypothetical protein
MSAKMVNNTVMNFYQLETEKLILQNDKNTNYDKGQCARVNV